MWHNLQTFYVKPNNIKEYRKQQLNDDTKKFSEVILFKINWKISYLKNFNSKKTLLFLFTFYL